MPTLQQAAALTAYHLRSSAELGRRKVTAQMVRDRAEPAALAYVTEHLDEYEDVPSAIKQYVDAVVDAFRMDHGILTQVEYDAHVQACKDAAEELERTRRWGFSPSDREGEIAYKAHSQSIQYVVAKYIPAPGQTQEEQRLMAQHLLGQQEVLGDMAEYRQQYIRSSKEWMAEQDELPEAHVKEASTDAPARKKRWWLF
jgi:hypothetical protein